MSLEINSSLKLSSVRPSNEINSSLKLSSVRLSNEINESSFINMVDDLREEVDEYKTEVDEYKTKVDTILDGASVDADSFKEVVDMVKNADDTIIETLSRKVNKSDIVNDFESTSTNQPLSANGGRILNEKINGAADMIQRIKTDMSSKPSYDTTIGSGTDTIIQLHPENNPNNNLYPNVLGENIPLQSIGFSQIKDANKTNNLYITHPECIKERYQIKDKGLEFYAPAYVNTNKISVTPNDVMYLFLKANKQGLSYRLMFTYYDAEGNYITKEIPDGQFGFPASWQRVDINKKSYYVKPYTVPSNASYMITQGDMSTISYEKNDEVMICTKSSFDGFFRKPYEIIPDEVDQKAFEKLKFKPIQLDSHYDHISFLPSNSFNVLATYEVLFNTLKSNSNSTIYRRKMTNTFSHDSSLVVYNNKGYSVYLRNDVDLGDSAQEINAMTYLSIVDDIANLNTNSTTIDIEIAKHGSVVGDKTIISGAGNPNVCRKDNLIYVFFTAKLSDNNCYSLCRVYDTSTETLSDIQILQIKLNDSYVDFTGNNAIKVVGLVDARASYIAMNASIAFDGTYYYSAFPLSPSGGSSEPVIIRSVDLLNWELYIDVRNFNLNVDMQFECSLCYFDNHLYACARRLPSYDSLMLLKFNGTNLVSSSLIKATNSRPHLFVYKNALYLIYGVEERRLTNVVEVDTMKFRHHSIISQLLVGAVYPFVTEDDEGNLYLSSTGSNSTTVYLRRFKFDYYNFTETTSILTKILDLFEE